jgi:hypothetical protein
MLKVSERTLRRLKLPRVKFGKQYRYRQADIEGFINLHIEYPETGGSHVSRVQKRSKKVGLSVLPSRAMLHATRLDSKTEARKAEREARTDAEKSPALQPMALATASGAYLIASAERGRSRWRIDGLNYTFKAHIVPHFGETALITDITPQMTENCIPETKRAQEQDC